MLNIIQVLACKIAVNLCISSLIVKHSYLCDLSFILLFFSGISGEVLVFSIPEGQHNNSSVLTPDFIHDGHLKNCAHSDNLTVTNHLWFPWQQNGIVSTASDGSLHAWQYKT